jgi:hypothetical protein
MNIMTFKQWLIDLFKDERGSTSVKPVVALLLSLCLGGTLIANSFSHGDIKPSDSLVNAVIVVIVVAIGGDTADKYTTLKKQIKDTNESNS